MKKNILIGVLTICFMSSLGYGVVQQSEAENQRKRADEMEMRAKEMEAVATEQIRLIEKYTRQAEAKRDSLIKQAVEAEKQGKK
jgi:hypothetical protein